MSTWVSHFMPNQLAKAQFLLATIGCVQFKQLIFRCCPVLDELTCAPWLTLSLTYTCSSQQRASYGLDEATKDRHGQAAVCWLAGLQGLFPMESSASSGSFVPFRSTLIVVHVESTCGSWWVYSCLHSPSPMWLCGEEGGMPFLLPLLR